VHFPKLKINTLQKTKPKVDVIEKSERGNETGVNPNSHGQNFGPKAVFHPVGE